MSSTSPPPHLVPVIESVIRGLLATLGRDAMALLMIKESRLVVEKLIEETIACL